MTNYYAAVIHNFVPGSDRELELKVGEKVMLFNWDDPEWWYGDLNGKSGYFPSTHVELLEEDDGSVPPPPPPPTEEEEDDAIPPPPPPSSSSPHAVGLWDCNAETQHELSFRAGDSLLVLDDTNPDWLFVELRGQRGYVPRNFVDYQTSSSAAPSSSSKPKRPDASTLPRNAAKADENKYVAIYDFPSQTAHQISLKAGEFVTVLDKSGGEWWKGDINGRTGLFPKSYVDLPSVEAFALIEKNNREDTIVTPPPVPLNSGSFITQNPNVNRSNNNISKLVTPEPEPVKSTPVKIAAAAAPSTTKAASTTTSTSVASKAPAAATTPAATATKSTPAATASSGRGGKICKGCNQTITGAFMEVDSGFYHKSCFVCNLCSTPLKKFFDKDDKIYCGDCFTNKVDVIPCGRCGKSLGSNVVKACGKRFHEECFTCFNCKTPLDNLINNRDGQPWCDACVKKVIPKSNPTARSSGPPKSSAPASSTGAGPKKTRTVPSKFQQQKMKYVSGFDD